MNLEKMTNEDLINLYPKILKILKESGVLQSKNFIGDVGEYLAISHYCNTKGLPNLQRAPASTKNVDAMSRDGERYSIKSSSTTGTGTFWGLNPPDSDKSDKQSFEHVIVVIFSKEYTLKKIIEINWEQFLELKRWYSRMNAWNLPVNSKLEKTGKVVFPV